jgi:hypothetical protein
MCSTEILLIIFNVVVFDTIVIFNVVVAILLIIFNVVVFDGNFVN